MESEPEEQVEVHKQYGKPRTFADRVAQVRQGTARAYDTVKQKTAEARVAYGEYKKEREVKQEQRKVQEIERYNKETNYLNAKNKALNAQYRAQRTEAKIQKFAPQKQSMFSNVNQKTSDYSSFQPSQGGLYSGDNMLKHIMGTGTGAKKTKQKPINKDWWR